MHHGINIPTNINKWNIKGVIIDESDTKKISVNWFSSYVLIVTLCILKVIWYWIRFPLERERENK